MLMMAALLCAPAGAAAANSHYVVVLRDATPDPGAVAADHARRYGVQTSHVYGSALKGYAASIPDGRLADVRSDPRVEFVTPDKPVEALAKPTGAPPQQLPTGINRIDGDLASTRAGDGGGSVATPVAIIDSGSGPHDDLNVVGGVSCVGGKYSDQTGHGTHVAGIVGAKDNGFGVVGVSPGAPLYSVRVLDRFGSGTVSTVACGIDWVTANAASTGINVANMSLRFQNSADDGNCGNTNNDALHKAICGSVTAGVTYVVGAGNEANDFATNVPAAYDEVLTVTGIADYDGRPGGTGSASCRAGQDDAAADFSSFGVRAEDQAHTMAAPGVCIYSTYPGGYNTLSGTSMASPHVAGLVAACLAAGKCSGAPRAVIDKVRTDAAAYSSFNSAFGFAGDPLRPRSGAFYGYLAYDGGY